MIPVSLDCPFLIAPSVFSNVYVIAHLNERLVHTHTPHLLRRIARVLITTLAEIGHYGWSSSHLIKRILGLVLIITLVQTGVKCTR